MSDKTILEKLQVKPGKIFKVINQPPDTIEILSLLPQGASMAARSELADVVLIFVKTMEEITEFVSSIDKVLKAGGVPWLAYPKKTASIKTALDRDVIWRYLQTIGWTGNSMISINDTWSGFRIKKV